MDRLGFSFKVLGISKGSKLLGFSKKYNVFGFNGVWESYGKVVMYITRTVHKMCTFITPVNHCNYLNLTVILSPAFTPFLAQLLPQNVIYITSSAKSFSELSHSFHRTNNNNELNI